MATDQVQEEFVRDRKAVTLDASQIKKTISGTKVQKRKNVVQVLDSPFIYDWSHLSPEHEQQILSLLSKMACPIRAESKGKFKTLPEDGTIAQDLQNKTKEFTTSARKHFAVGLRDVTKAVTKSEVLVVFCEKSTDPSFLTKLLIPICQVKGTLLIPIKHFSPTMSKPLNVLRCLTLALKKPVDEAESPFHKTYLEIRELLNLKATKPSLERPAELVLSSRYLLVPGTPGSDLKKRKLTESSSEEFRPEEKYHLKKGSSGFRFIPNVTRNPVLTTNEILNNGATFGADFIALNPAKDEPITSRNMPILRRPKLKIIERDAMKTNCKNKSRKP